MPDSTRSDPSEPDSVRRDAAEWFVLCERGLTPSEEARFADWIRADPGHAEALSEFEETWEKLGDARPAVSAAAPPRRTRALPWFALPLAAAAGLVLAIASWGWLGRDRVPAPAAATETVVTAVGETRRLALADGSVLSVNTDSRLSVRMTPAERGVRLERGEAQFQVGSDPSRPFVVRVAGMAIRDVGTVFDVRLRRDSVEVLVTAGEVRIERNGAGASVVAGQRAVVPLDPPGAAPSVASVARADADRSLAWRERRLEFASEPLADIVDEFNRYNRHRLVVADPGLAKLRFGGTYPVDDYRSFVRLLERTSRVTAEERGDETVLRRAR